MWAIAPGPASAAAKRRMRASSKRLAKETAVECFITTLKPFLNFQISV